MDTGRANEAETRCLSCRVAQAARRASRQSAHLDARRADDLGVGMSTLNKWITAHRDTDVVSNEDLSLAKENDRLRREIRLLKEEREILKKATCYLQAIAQ